MSKINELLELVDQFEGRKRIEFDDADDCNFVIKVFRALKEAAPEIRASVFNPEVRMTTPENGRATEGLARGWVKPLTAEDLKSATTQPTPVAESVQTPSNAEPTSQAVESSSHIQVESPNTAGTDATTGHTAGTSDKPASGAGMTIGQQAVVAAKAARGKRKQARLKAASEALTSAAPPAAPQATVGSETT